MLSSFKPVLTVNTCSAVPTLTNFVALGAAEAPRMLADSVESCLASGHDSLLPGLETHWEEDKDRVPFKLKQVSRLSRCSLCVPSSAQARVGAARCCPLWEGTGPEKLELRVEHRPGPTVHGSRSTKMEAGTEAGASQAGGTTTPPPVGAGASALFRVDRSCYRGVVTTLQSADTVLPILQSASLRPREVEQLARGLGQDPCGGLPLEHAGPSRPGPLELLASGSGWPQPQEPRASSEVRRTLLGRIGPGG